MSKSWNNRLTDTLDYLDTLAGTGAIPQSSVAGIRQRLDDGSFGSSKQEVSKALHFGWEGLFTRYAKGQSKPQRVALRALMLTMLMHQSHRIPYYTTQTIKTIGSSSTWKRASQADINREISRLLRAGSPPPSVQGSSGRVHDPTQYGGYSYGATASQLGSTKSGLKTPSVSTAQVPAPIVIPKTGTFGAKSSAFEEASRARRVLSGHGSWIFDDTLNAYPWTRLKKGQKIFFYVPHYVALSNSVGQLVDNHQTVAVHSRFGASTSRIPDYTLHHRGSLKLLGHSKHDKKFVTTASDHRLSHYINSFGEGVDIHWAACRVVQGWVWSNTAGDWVWAMWDTDKWEYTVGTAHFTKTSSRPPQFGPLP